MTAVLRILDRAQPLFFLQRSRFLSNARGGSLLEKLSARAALPTPSTMPVEPITSEAGERQAEEDEDEMEEMFVATSKGLEWGGPMRGGRYNEPTRFGDWEQKGRCSDF